MSKVIFITGSSRGVGKAINRPIYALDDNSALKIIDNKIEVISEGEWFVINKK